MLSSPPPTQADLAEMSQVRQVVSELQSKEKKVDCIVCNAGVLLNDRKLSSEGNELTFASHLLGGSFLLSNLLLPQLKASGDGRVIFVSSAGMYNYKFPDWEMATSTGEMAEKYDGQFAYTYAKRGKCGLCILTDEYFAVSNTIVLNQKVSCKCQL